MTEAPETWRQEIELILREIAADPKARLLRVPSVDSVLSLAQQSPVGTLAPSLTKAERYLLQTHREELAFLLRERCVMEFYGAPGADMKWHRSVTIREDVELPEESDWHRRASGAIGCELDFDRLREASDVLRRCVRAQANTLASYEHFALVSLKVAPSDAARVYSGLRLLDLGQFEQSRAISHEVGRSTSSEVMASMCWENEAYALQSGGRARDATAAYRIATETCTARIAPPLFWLASAIASGDVEGAAEAAKVVDERVPLEHAAIEWTENCVRRFVRSDPRARRPIEPPRVFGSFGEAPARILNAFSS